MFAYLLGQKLKTVDIHNIYELTYRKRFMGLM